MDWFVLLTPLALLPIFLLFVFIGCPFPTSGKGSHCFFTYPGGLTDNGNVTSITVELEYGSDFDCGEEEGSTFGPTPPPPTTIDPVNPNGEKVSLGLISLDCSGHVICRVTFTGTAGGSSPESTKYKEEDEPAPDFILTSVNTLT